MSVTLYNKVYELGQTYVLAWKIKNIEINNMVKLKNNKNRHFTISTNIIIVENDWNKIFKMFFWTAANSIKSVENKYYDMFRNELLKYD